MKHSCIVRFGMGIQEKAAGHSVDAVGGLGELNFLFMLINILLHRSA